MEFSVLGFVEVHENGRTYRPKASKLCEVLGLLAFRANQFVATETIMHELWGDSRPASSLTTAQTYIYHLRRAFSRELGVSRPEDVLTTRPSGYLLRVEHDDDVDCVRFEQLVKRGQTHVDASRWSEASAILREALALWRTPPMGNLTGGQVISMYLHRLEELRRIAIELRVTADLQLGRFRELIPELRDQVAENPLNEWFHAQLMTCLSMVGRRGEALQAYQRARHILIEELGLEPSTELQQLQRTMLAAS